MGLASHAGTQTQRQAERYNFEHNGIKIDDEVDVAEQLTLGDEGQQVLFPEFPA